MSDFLAWDSESSDPIEDIRRFMASVKEMPGYAAQPALTVSPEVYRWLPVAFSPKRRRIQKMLGRAFEDMGRVAQALASSAQPDALGAATKRLKTIKVPEHELMGSVGMRLGMELGGVRILASKHMRVDDFFKSGTWK